VPVDGLLRLAQVDILIISLNTLFEFVIALSDFLLEMVNEIFLISLDPIELDLLLVELVPERLCV
jgi:hypothetical protein